MKNLYENIRRSYITFIPTEQILYKYRALIYSGLIFVILYLISLYDYVIFHSLSEITTMAIALSIFVIAWNTRRFISNNFFTFLGIPFFYAGILIILHALSYQGINLFNNTNNLPTQLWIAYRYFFAFTFLAAFFLKGFRLRAHIFFITCGLITLAILFSIFFFDIFPDAYANGIGLTLFKKISEFVISLLFAIALILLFKNRDTFSRKIFVYLLFSLFFLIASDLLFALYKTVFDFINFTGHILNIFGFLFIYKALVETTLQQPLTLIFKEINESKERLEESEAKFRSFAELSRNAYIITDEATNIIFWNQGAEKIFGYKMEEILNSPLPKLISEKDKETQINRMVALNISRKKRLSEIPSEIEGVKKDGRLFPAEMTFCRWKTNNKIFWGLILRDISSQKFAEESTRRAYAYTKNIVDSIWTPLVVLDKNYKILSANDNFYYFFKIEKKNTDRKNFFSINNSVWKNDRLKKRIDDIFISGNPLHEFFLTQNFPKIGKKTLLINGNRIKNEGLSEDLIILSLHDYTDHRKSAEKLNLNTRRLKNLTQDLKKFKLAVENTYDLIYITDKNGEIIFVNNAAEPLTGYSQKEIIGKKPEFWSEQPKKGFEIFHKKIMPGKTFFAEEVARIKKNGEKYIASIRFSPTFDGSGNVLFFVAIERNITKIKEFDRAKDEFISLASHQLRTPLTSINLSAEMLLQGVAGKLLPSQKKYLKNISRDVYGMADLIEALLNVSRIEMGKFLTDIKTQSVVDIIKSTLAEVDPQIKNKKIKLKVVTPPHIPLIKLDRNILRIALQNLLSNAIKYTPEKGAITVNLEKTSYNIVICITDSGLGIPQKEHKKIFSKMYRAENILAQKTEGLGLGLYMAKSLLNKANCKIWFKSEENKGSCFCISIPLRGMKQIKEVKK